LKRTQILNNRDNDNNKDNYWKRKEKEPTMKKKAHSCSVFGSSSPIHTIDVFERKMLKLIQPKILRVLMKTRKNIDISILAIINNLQWRPEYKQHKRAMAMKESKAWENSFFFTNGSGRHRAVK
jgi:hypothetical protein